MTRQEVLECLCCYDKRNPNYSDFEYLGEDTPEPRKDCYCDNCFRGKDRLALELLKYITE